VPCFIRGQAMAGVSAKKFQKLPIACIQTVTLWKQVEEDDRAFRYTIEAKRDSSADAQ